MPYRAVKTGNENITIKDYLFTIKDLLEQVVHVVNKNSDNVQDCTNELKEFRKELNSLERL